MFLGSEAAQKANKWQGRNITRWQNPEYDATYKQAAVELDPIKRIALLIKLNDLVIDDIVVIPVVTRPSVSAMNKNLVAELSGFDSYIWNYADWYMDS
jgi:peptide/nickel transport system substrate-binding protein